ncbi:hypothetical protein [Streptomyces sp. NPDC059874]
MTRSPVAPTATGLRPFRAGYAEYVAGLMGVVMVAHWRRRRRMP